MYQAMTSKDFFISYGRKESLAQAGKLHQLLCLKGKEVWFDKVNIPSGDDYWTRIQHGIRSANHFIFFLTPRSMTSPYCFQELEYAVMLGKHIIPFLHIEETEEDINAYTAEEKECRDRTQELLGRRDWLKGREVKGDIEVLAVWREEYENSWQQFHNDLTFLESWKCPIRWEAIDLLEETVDKLLLIIQREEAHVSLHTDLLLIAYDWELSGRPSNALLVGSSRKEAEDWLLQDFAGDLPPCTPSALHVQFICASKKHAQHMMTEVFLSYSSVDKEYMQNIHQALERKAITTWLHSNDIDKTKEYSIEINKGIEQADNFLFFLSVDSLQSVWCLQELQYAFALNKRVIPIKVNDHEGFELPEEVADAQEIVDRLFKIQYINFTNDEEAIDEVGRDEFERDLEDIIREIHRDREYYAQHKVLLTQALRWKEKQQPSYLLQGHNLENASTWLMLHQDRETHPPTELHQEFIGNSEQAKGLYPAEVFISYSRKDADFAHKLNRALQACGRFTWFDQESIASGVDFDQEIFNGIEKAHNFLFIITPDAIASNFCEKELAFAAKLEKRFIPVLLEEAIDYQLKLPEVYAQTQWIDFSESDIFEKAFQSLIIVLDTDREYVKGHTEWQQRALEWEQSDRSPDYLLNASAYESAQSWLESVSEDKKPQPTDLQKEYFKVSKKAIDRAVLKEHKKQAKLTQALEEEKEARIEAEEKIEELQKALEAAQKALREQQEKEG